MVSPKRESYRSRIDPAVLLEARRATKTINEISDISTSRTKQESDLSSLAGAPGARVFATRGLRVRKELASAERAKKSFSQIEAKENELRPF